MAAGIGTELFNLASSFDPYGAYREGGMAPQKYDIEQQKLDVQQQAMKEAQQELGGAKPAGMQAGAQPLAGMAKSMMPPGILLQTPDGVPTSSGLLNQQLMNSQQDFAESQKMMKEATIARAMGDTKNYGDLANKAKLLQTTATQNMANAKKEYQKSIDDGLESAYLANSQTDYDQRVKDALERTGIPMPKGLPEKWTPEVKAILLGKMSPEARSKVEKEEYARNREKRADEDQRFQRNREAARDKELTGILGAITGKEYADVKGQVEGLRAFLPDDRIKRLSGREIPKVSSTIQSVVKTNELADLVEKHPLSAGVPSQIINSFEKYLPSRYEKDEEGGANQSKILSDVEKTMKSKNASPDEIDYSRLIAKKVLDVVNARALAASGGGRLLISELNRQSEVLKSSGLTPSSAPFVYRELAQGDLTALESTYGIKPEEFKGLSGKKSEAPKSAETKPNEPKSSAVKAMPDEPKLKAYADAHFGGDLTKAKSYLSTQGYK